MKTLDEVIKACEETVSDVDRGVDIEGCYLGATETKDALHYLKEYRDECNNIINVHDDYIRLRDEMAEELNKANPALSWDELKQMEGKPIWVEALLYKQWAVIGYVGENHILFEGVNLYAAENRTYMGAEDGWQAYRKERK